MDIELIISEVSKRPVLWDMMAEEYKDKKKKNDCWKEVCYAVVEDFSLQNENEQKLTVSEVIKKWRTVRDNYMRYYKKQQDSYKSGSATKVITQYVYHDQLSFLQKIKDHRQTVCSIPQEQNETENPQLPLEKNQKELRKSSEAVVQNSEISGPKKKKTSSSMQLETKLVSFLDSYIAQVEDDDMSFFKSLMPSIKKLREEQKMEFRIGVMKMLQELHSRIHDVIPEAYLRTIPLDNESGESIEITTSN